LQNSTRKDRGNFYNSISIPRDSNIPLIQALTREAGNKSGGKYSPILSGKIVNLDYEN
jgi:hypothetical protein